MVFYGVREWVDKTLHTTLPKGALGKALGYLNKNWDKLTVYLEDGELAIDNNRAENVIRPSWSGARTGCSAIPRAVLMPVPHCTA